MARPGAGVRRTMGAPAMLAFALSLAGAGCGASRAATPQGGPATQASPQPAAPAPLLPIATDPRDLAVAAMLDREVAGAPYANLRSLIVLHAGRTVYERYYSSSPEDYHQVFSITRGIMSTLVGIAIAEHDLPGLDTPLAELLPEYADRMSDRAARATLGQLLTNTGGFGFGMSPRGDAVEHILKEQDWEPGRAFRYSNASAHLTSAVLTRATGQTALQYARAKLFRPLGIASRNADQGVIRDLDLAALQAPGFGWAQDGMGNSNGALGLRLRGRDLAKIGLLHLAGGRWDGQRVLPRTWVRAATTDQVGAPLDQVGYGYLWWTGPGREPVFQLLGHGGQLLKVWPERDLVVVHQAWVDPGSGSEGPLAARLADLVDHQIAPAWPQVEP